MKSEIEARRAEGFRELADEDERTLLIECAVEEVCCFVVDFLLAKGVIEEDLDGTEFANDTRIFDEDGDD